jgi:hypothetical protein
MQREQLKDGECTQGAKALRERELKEAAGVLPPTTVPRVRVRGCTRRMEVRLRGC